MTVRPLESLPQATDFPLQEHSSVGDIVLAIEGVINILQKEGFGSVVDLSLPLLVLHYRVVCPDAYIHSDHQTIFFYVCVEPQGKEPPYPKRKKFQAGLRKF